MRSLRRASQARIPTSTGTGLHHAEELRTIKRRERIGVLRLLVLGGLLMVVAAAMAWSAHGRIVSEGLVEANLVEVRAPGRVRVEEVRCLPGKAFRRGEVLFVLEALGVQGERRSLELDIERAALRLSLAEAGGDLGEVNLDRRIGEAEDAEREWRLAEAALEVAHGRLEVLRRRLDAVLATGAREAEEQLGLARAAEERAAESTALAGRSEVERAMAEYDERSRSELSAAGIVSERDRRRAEASRDGAGLELEAHLASARALEEDARTLRRGSELERRATEARASELEAELEAAQLEVEALRVRRDQWRTATLRSRVLAASGPEGVSRLRKLELDLLRKELESARARLAAFDRRVGNLTVRAEADGVCDQLLVSPGVVAAEDELLATHYDPATRRVVAYVGPGGAEELEAGRACSVTPIKGDESHPALVAAVAGAWVPRPAAIPGSAEPSEDRRLAFRLGLQELPEHYRPGMRVTVVFDRAPEPIPEQQPPGLGADRAEQGPAGPAGGEPEAAAPAGATRSAVEPRSGPSEPARGSDPGDRRP